MKGFVALALLLAGALLLAAQFLVPAGPLTEAAPAASAGAAPRPAPGRFAGDALTLTRDPTGRFHIDGAVNGAPVRFLVDTGADTIALSVADAQAAGIEVNPNGFIPILRTASGEGWGTMVTLERIVIGDTELRNVGAVVVRDLDVSLLGQTVLARMGRVELKGDRMVIEQQP